MLTSSTSKPPFLWGSRSLRLRGVVSPTAPHTTLLLKLPTLMARYDGALTGS